MDETSLNETEDEMAPLMVKNEDIDTEESQASDIRNKSTIKWWMCVAISTSWLASYFIAWFPSCM